MFESAPTAEMSATASNESEQYIIALLGGGGVGKSCITTQFVWRTWNGNYEATIEDTFHTKLEVDGKVVNLVVLDTAGQEEYESLRDDWIRHADAIILVYDVTSTQSVKDLSVFAKSIGRVNFDKYGKVFTPPNQCRTELLPIAIAGNKRDLVANADTHAGYKSTRSDIEKLARNFTATFPGMRPEEIKEQDLKSLPILETSAKERTNIDEVFQVAVRQIRKFNKFNEGEVAPSAQESTSGEKPPPKKKNFREVLKMLLPQKGGKAARAAVK